MKTQRIVITGGLGYIGTSLCELYSGEARYKEIIVLDNRFISERVQQLRNWGISFIHGDILDESLLRQVLAGADIVYHLAGVTDVAYVRTEADELKDNLIKQVGVIGTLNVIKYAGGAKIVFPSTHVVFGGLKDTKFNITEEEPVVPDLTYATGKCISEADIVSGVENYIILRLGSLYGVSGDTMRINIMPNLFSKIASQNGTISLYSGGVQHKSLVALMDVVRAMKFLAESQINREIFHVSNENMTIKDVALICQKHNPEVKIVATDNEIPNFGYTLSNKKLLATGFKFLYNIDTCIKEMIEKWSEKPQPEALEYIQRGGKEFADDRGRILNYELTEPINLIGAITSKRGTVRANHYHPIQEQKCLLISGKYVSVIKDLAVENAKIEMRLIRPGDIAVIRPNVAHAMVFLQDSYFLNLVRGEREHENYGITHTIPYPLVDEKMRLDIIENYKYSCRACRHDDLWPVVDLGMSPLANNLLDSIDEPAKLYPLEMKYCPLCHNCQLSYVVPAGKMFDNYLYTSSTAESFRKHFENAAEQYIKEFNLDENSFVIDIGSNDGVFLKPLMDRGIKVLGVEPAKNIAEAANAKGIHTINAYFTLGAVLSKVQRIGKADLITASNVFAHADDLTGIVSSAFSLLKPEGTFIIEVQYLMDTIIDLTFDNIYHEHVQYWTVTSLLKFFENMRLCLYKVEHIDTHGGSIRCYIKKQATRDNSVARFLISEQEFGVTDYPRFYQNFGNRIATVKQRVLKKMNEIKSLGVRIAAYGSPAKATTCLNYFGIDNNYIEYTIEDNPLKHGKFIPGVNIPIVSKEHALQNLPDVIIVLAWNFFEEIKKNNQDLINKGVEFISIKELQ